jgi:hypothetical protein
LPKLHQIAIEVNHQHIPIAPRSHRRAFRFKTRLLEQRNTLRPKPSNFVPESNVDNLADGKK